MTNKPLLGLAYIMAGLIVLVVVVGLAQGKIDPTGIAQVLAGVLSGIVAGILLRQSKGGGDNKGGGGDAG